MSGFETADLRELKARVSIVDLVRRYVNLRNAGGRWSGPCPFHQETKPSFSVNEQEGFFYCFGCQAHGDVIDFFARINGLEFREAVEQLAAEAGVTLRKSAGRQFSPEQRQERDFTRLCLEMYAQAQNRFRQNLQGPQGQTCRAYLQGRGTDAELAAAFGLGFSLPGWDDLLGFLRQKGFAPEQAAKAGLLSKNERNRVFDRFRERLMFPIHNLSGQVIAFGGRVIRSDQDPKYINSSDTAIYKKGDHLYGLFQARRAITHTRCALLTEGYMDVLTLHGFGYANACGVLGTALTEQQIKRLSGFCSRVDLLFDGDRAGRQAALRSARMLLLRGLGCRVVLFPEGEDVDSLLRKQGKPALDSLLQEAMDGLEYCLKSIRENSSPKEMLEWTRSFAKELADPALLSVYIPRLAQGLGLAEEELRSLLTPGAPPSQKAAPTGRYPGRRSERFGRPVRPEERVPQGGETLRQKHERQLLSFAVRYPQHVPRLHVAGAGRFMVDAWARQLWATLQEAQGGDVLPLLGEQEKRFFIQCRLDCQALQESEAAELEGILQFLELERAKEKQAAITRSLPQAGQDDLELLRVLQQTLGRNDGQH